MRLKLLLLFTIFFSLFTITMANANMVAKEFVPKADIVGQVRMKYMMLNIYDATLYAPSGQWSFSQPFALELHYLISLKGSAIAKRSIDEMQNLGLHDSDTQQKYYDQMAKIFPNVQSGDVITGLCDKNGHSIFYLNNKKIGQIDDPDFSKYFFGIWLNEKTSEPKLRRQLLGMK